MAQTARDWRNYEEQIEACYTDLCNPFAYYECLVEQLLQVEDLQIVPLCELADAEPSQERLLGLRHDVDADPLTALRAARCLARRGVCGSFYLLHSAPYYGDFLQGLFVRNAELAKWVRGFIVAGCELGLHNDAFGVCTVHGIDGPAAVREEVEWLRSQGAVVSGTVAHNSGPVYGAENFEVFQERLLWRRGVRTARGDMLPLGALSERLMGLTYEGAFAVPRPNMDQRAATLFLRDKTSADVRSEQWMRRYMLENPCMDRAIDFQFWLIGRDSWIAAGRNGTNKLFEWDIDLERVISLIRELPPATRAVVLVHPAYVRG